MFRNFFFETTKCKNSEVIKLKRTRTKTGTRTFLSIRSHLQPLSHIITKYDSCYPDHDITRPTGHFPIMHLCFISRPLPLASRMSMWAFLILRKGMRLPSFPETRIWNRRRWEKMREDERTDLRKQKIWTFVLWEKECESRQRRDRKWQRRRRQGDIKDSLGKVVYCAAVLRCINYRMFLCAAGLWIESQRHRQKADGLTDEDEV